MSARTDIVVADIYCIACGHSLRLRPVEQGCPACGVAVQESLRRTILAGGHRHVRRIARALMLAGWLNAGLGIGCVLNPTTMVITGWYAPLGVLYLLSLSTFAWLQVLAAARAAQPRPGEAGGIGRVVLVFTASCFAGATLAALAGMTGYAFGVEAESFYARAGLACRALLPGLAVFVWVLGGVYERLCRTAGMSALGRRSRRVKVINTLGAGLMAGGCLLTPTGLGFLDVRHLAGTREMTAAFLLGAGLLLTIIGMVFTTILQFLMAQRLKDLSETLGDRVVLTGFPVE